MSLFSQIYTRIDILLRILISGIWANFICDEYVIKEIILTSFPISPYSLSLIISYDSANSALQNEMYFFFIMNVVAFYYNHLQIQLNDHLVWLHARRWLSLSSESMKQVSFIIDIKFHNPLSRMLENLSSFLKKFHGNIVFLLIKCTNVPAESLNMWCKIYQNIWLFSLSGVCKDYF